MVNNKAEERKNNTGSNFLCDTFGLGLHMHRNIAEYVEISTVITQKYFNVLVENANFFQMKIWQQSNFSFSSYLHFKERATTQRRSTIVKNQN